MREVTQTEFEQFTNRYYGGYKSKIDTNEDPFIEYFFPKEQEKWTGTNHVAHIIYYEEGNKYYINE